MTKYTVGSLIGSLPKPSINWQLNLSFATERVVTFAQRHAAAGDRMPAVFFRHRSPEDTNSREVAR